MDPVTCTVIISSQEEHDPHFAVGVLMNVSMHLYYHELADLCDLLSCVLTPLVLMLMHHLVTVGSKYQIASG